MNHLFWCSDCIVLYDRSSQHNGHKVTDLAGDDAEGIINALDEAIQYGLDILQNREQEVANATQVKNDIEEFKKSFIEVSESRIVRVCQDVKVAMECSYDGMLKVLNERVQDLEFKAKNIIATSDAKFNQINKFIEQSAVTLPDHEGNLDPTQLSSLFGCYDTVRNIADQPRANLQYPDEFEVTLPNSYEQRKACQILAKSMSGKMEDQNGKIEEEPVTVPLEVIAKPVARPLRKPLKRQISKDLCKT